MDIMSLMFYAMSRKYTDQEIAKIAGNGSSGELGGEYLTKNDVDNTLSQAGKIADAAATGKAIHTLTEELQRVESMVIIGGAAPPVATKEIAGIVKPGPEFAVADDGTLSLQTIDIVQVAGLNERLVTIEQAITENDLSGYVKKEELREITKKVDYEIAHKPDGVLVNYADKEIRVMCPADTQWVLQKPGVGADAHSYYIGFKAYAPDDCIVSFKEDLGEFITDNTMYYFENNEFAGIDEYGRKYSIVWLPVAAYDEATQAWTYYGAKSSTAKYVGWYYSVEWYNAAGVKVAADVIRINLSNENCHTSVTPFYITDVQSALTALEESVTWDEL